MALTIQLVTYSEIEDLSSLGRIKKLLSMAKENKIVMLQGRLKKEEEAELIKTTMEEINREFKGIELYVLHPSAKSDDFIKKTKDKFFSFILKDREGLTIIGPASVVKEIRRDPTRIELLTRDIAKKKGRK